VEVELDGVIKYGKARSAVEIRGTQWKPRSNERVRSNKIANGCAMAVAPIVGNLDVGR
jgi:hypothetical protein